MEPEDREGGPPKEKGRVPPAGGGQAAAGGRPCPWDLVSRPSFAYKQPIDLKRRAPEHFSQKPYGAPPPSRTLNSGSRIDVRHPAGVEIAAIATANASRSTIHVVPLHV